MTARTRADWLRNLITGTVSAQDATRHLASFGWDSETPAVLLSRSDAAAVLRRYVNGERTAAEVCEWADALESREDIEYDPTAGDSIGDLLFELANPEINRPLTPELAAEWLRQLGR